MLNYVQRAIENIREGRHVILLDSPNREDEGDFVIAAAKLNGANSNLVARYGNDMWCAAMTVPRLKFLGLRPEPRYHAKDGCNFYTSVDALGTSGEQTYDRKREAIRALLSQKVSVRHEDSQLKTPCHVRPLGAHPEGLDGRQGHTEGSLALVQYAGFLPVAVISEVMDRETGNPMKGGKKLEDFANEHNLTVVFIENLIKYHAERSNGQIYSHK